MRRHSLTLALLCVLTCPSPGVAQAGIDPVEKVLLSPPATGLLVIGVVEGSQAHELGIERGSIIVAYDGEDTPDLDSLLAAVAGAQEKTSVVLDLVTDDGEPIEEEVVPGRLGVELAVVEKGKPASPLPPQTVERLDLSRLADAPLDRWFEFFHGGDPGKQVGFEHLVLSLADGVLTQRHEVAFDGGEQWGRNHMLVDLTVAVDEDGRLQPRSTRYENGLNGWTGENRVAEGAEGEPPVLQVVWTDTAGGKTERAAPMPTDLQVVPTYLAVALAGFMPREAGACLHYRPLEEGMGSVGMRSALHVVGKEAVTIAGKEQEAWRVELRQLGVDTRSTCWVDDSGETLTADFGGARTIRSTRERALEGSPEGIESRTDR